MVSWGIGALGNSGNEEMGEIPEMWKWEHGEMGKWGNVEMAKRQ